MSYSCLQPLTSWERIPERPEICHADHVQSKLIEEACDSANVESECLASGNKCDDSLRPSSDSKRFGFLPRYRRRGAIGFTAVGAVLVFVGYVAWNAGFRSPFAARSREFQESGVISASASHMRPFSEERLPCGRGDHFLTDSSPDGAEEPCSPLGSKRQAAEDTAGIKRLILTCKRARISCDWTAQWSCPGQVAGAKGLAADDSSIVYKCCCGPADLWKKANTVIKQTEITSPEADWKVIARTGVAVSLKATPNSKVLGRRQFCQVIRASRKGNWLHLAGDAGYMPISSENGFELMQPVPNYLKIPHGFCSEFKWYPVRDHESCLRAARWLNIETPSVGIRKYGRDGDVCVHTSLHNTQVHQAICSSSPEDVVQCNEPPSSASVSETLPAKVHTTPTLSTTEYLPILHRKSTSPTLFCYSVVRAHGYEFALVREQLKQGVGIFACDKFGIFSSPKSFRLGKAPKKIGGPFTVRSVAFKEAKVGVSKDNTAGNTQLFMNVWDSVRAHSDWRTVDFIVKMDPDAVLMPSRLKDHLRPYIDWGGTYIKNCNKVPGNPDFPMMFGALEVFSRAALQKYFDHKETCEKLPWKPWGEDFFMTKCLDKLGVPGLGDFEILGDNYCTGANCGDGVMAAYHPFKTIASWFDCWGQASVAHHETLHPVPRPAPK